MDCLSEWLRSSKAYFNLRSSENKSRTKSSNKISANQRIQLFMPYLSNIKLCHRLLVIEYFGHFRSPCIFLLITMKVSIIENIYTIMKCSYKN